MGLNHIVFLTLECSAPISVLWPHCSVCFGVPTTFQDSHRRKLHSDFREHIIRASRDGQTVFASLVACPPVGPRGSGWHIQAQRLPQNWRSPRHQPAAVAGSGSGSAVNESTEAPTGPPKRPKLIGEVHTAHLRLGDNANFSGGNILLGKRHVVQLCTLRELFTCLCPRTQGAGKRCVRTVRTPSDCWDLVKVSCWISEVDFVCVGMFGMAQCARASATMCAVRRESGCFQVGCEFASDKNPLTFASCRWVILVMLEWCCEMVSVRAVGICSEPLGDWRYCWFCVTGKRRLLHIVC